jgi:hypothetical protein
MRARTSAFAEILAILQNEEPLFFGFIESTKVGYLATTNEPVGEVEGFLPWCPASASWPQANFL